MQYIYKYQSPIGGITIASDGSSLTGLWFDGQKYFAASLSPEHEEKVLHVFEQKKVKKKNKGGSGARGGSFARIRANHRMARLLFQWEKSRFHA